MYFFLKSQKLKMLQVFKLDLKAMEVAWWVSKEISVLFFFYKTKIIPLLQKNV